MLSAAYLRERLDYDPSTGDFTWRPKDGMRADDGRWNSRYAGRRAGSVDVSEGYARVRIDGVLYKAQVVAWAHFYGEWPGHVVDHADRLRSNNAIGNLRAATLAQNAQNASLRRDNTARVKGVSLHKATGKWRANIRVGGRSRHLGLFDDVGAAAAAYQDAAKHHYGEFATTGL